MVGLFGGVLGGEGLLGEIRLLGCCGVMGPLRGEDSGVEGVLVDKNLYCGKGQSLRGSASPVTPSDSVVRGDEKLESPESLSVNESLPDSLRKSAGNFSVTGGTAHDSESVCWREV